MGGTSRWVGDISADTSGAGSGAIARLGASNGGTLILDGDILANGTGQLVFQTGSGSDNTGTIIVNGDISHANQRLTKSITGAPSGTLILNGTNNYGQTIISGGVVQIGNGGTTGTLGSGIVDISSGSGGTLAFKRSDNVVVSNVITGGGSFSHRGSGTVTLAGENTYTGGTSMSGGGTLLVDFTAVTKESNIAGAGKLTLSGGTFVIKGKDAGTTSQTYSATDFAVGKNEIVVNSNGGTATDLSLGTINRTSTGAVANFTLPAAGSIKTTSANTNGILGGYATVGSSNWATIDAAGNIGALGTYTNDTWAPGNNTTVTGDSTQAEDVTTNSVRFDSNTAATVTLSGTANVIESGGILVTPNVGNNESRIVGGTIKAPSSSSDLVIIQNNTAAGLTITSLVGSSVTKSGDGLLTLTGNSGAGFTTRILAGTISVNGASNLGTQAANAVVFPVGSTGTLQLTGNNSFSSAKTVKLDGNGTIAVLSRATLTAPNAVNGVGSFTKTGAGLLTFSAENSSNSYTGATTIKGGTLEVKTLADGGLESGIGASSSAAENLVLDGGSLRFSSSANIGNTDRLFTVGAAGGTIEASGGDGFTMNFTNSGAVAFSGGSGPRTLTLGGTNLGENVLTPSLGDAGLGATALLKTGAGSWSLSGDNTYSGGTIVAGGSITGSMDGAFGTGNVTVQSTAVKLTIQTGVLDAIADAAVLSLAGDGATDGLAIRGYAFLAAGVNETIGGLVLGGITMAPGSYGATGSGAAFINDDYFQGTGLVTVVPEPGSVTLLGASLGLLTGFARLRRRSR